MSIMANRKLKDWRAFIKIVEKQSITAAAEALNIEVSTASKYLTRLEEALGMVLIERNTRSMNVTAQGWRIYEKIQLILGDLDAFYNELGDKNQQMAGLLRIAAPAELCEFKLSGYIVDFQALYPQARFHLHAFGRGEDVTPSDFDIIMKGGVQGANGLVRRPLDSINLIVCASRAYAASFPAISHPSHLAEHPLLPLWDHSISGNVRFSQAGEECFTLHPQPGGFTTNSVLAQFNLMLSGAGISVATPGWLAYDSLRRGEVVRLLPDWRISPGEMHLHWVNRKYYSPLFLGFADYLEKRWRERKKVVDL